MRVLPGAEPYYAAGGRVGVVVCHGFTGHPSSVRPWAQHLAAAGLSVAAPLLPGHGTRWQDLNRTRWTDWYGELERAFAALRDQCETVFAAGLSMGATLSIRLAEQHGEEVAGLVLVNPSLTTTRKDAKLLPLAALFIPSLAGVGGDVKKSGVPENAYPRLPLKAAASLTELWRVTRADLARVTQPTLLFRSRTDHVVEPVNARLLLAGISAGDVEERVLDDSYHVATLDNDAPSIFAESLTWMRAHSAESTAATHE